MPFGNFFVCFLCIKNFLKGKFPNVGRCAKDKEPAKINTPFHNSGCHLGEYVGKVAQIRKFCMEIRCQISLKTLLSSFKNVMN